MLMASVNVPAGATMGTITGLGLFNVIGSVALAPATGGASLLLGVASAGLTGMGVAVTSKICVNIDDSDANDRKKSVNLKHEIKETDNRLGRTSDYETEKYEQQYLQEVPSKECCRIT
ncbi:hypothetical protein [endosymbiont GvMRE of Glomus versiforme]|uniref:hypothetical protein n=1 Tax=endosymbiont GvMRE of Glomus versiforme TaxID=2039283 RepID=UPI000EEB558A|nr:hypothetical protein [endosymbiont GvMRE of Glomus versiforme]RHZ35211.1 hypothetical protein GvMRE_IIg212 [endosymbiont GvMRE of Glomus versiforme]